MGDLLKTQPGSQILTLFSAPQVTDSRGNERLRVVTMKEEFP